MTYSDFHVSWDVSIGLKLVSPNVKNEYRPVTSYLVDSPVTITGSLRNSRLMSSVISLSGIVVSSSLGE